MSRKELFLVVVLWGVTLELLRKRSVDTNPQSHTHLHAWKKHNASHVAVVLGWNYWLVTSARRPPPLSALLPPLQPPAYYHNNNGNNNKNSNNNFYYNYNYTTTTTTTTIVTRIILRGFLQSFGFYESQRVGLSQGLWPRCERRSQSINALWKREKALQKFQD